MAAGERSSFSRGTGALRSISTKSITLPVVRLTMRGHPFHRVSIVVRARAREIGRHPHDSLVCLARQIEIAGRPGDRVDRIEIADAPLAQGIPEARIGAHQAVGETRILVRRPAAARRRFLSTRPPYRLPGRPQPHKDDCRHDRRSPRRPGGAPPHCAAPAPWSGSSSAIRLYR